MADDRFESDWIIYCCSSKAVSTDSALNPIPIGHSMGSISRHILSETAFGLIASLNYFLFHRTESIDLVK
jgi:hypothetical protein